MAEVPLINTLDFDTKHPKLENEKRFITVLPHILFTRSNMCIYMYTSFYSTTIDLYKVPETNI